jgi:hypothetical protein
MTQSTSYINYVNVSAEAENDNSKVYEFGLEDKIKINGSLGEAKNIKLGDNIRFSHYDSDSRKFVEKTFEVKFVGLVKYPFACFTGNCLIETPLGRIPVNNLKIGDLVITPQGEILPVKCILITRINNHIDMMVHSDGLIITGFHPVKISDKWCFPSDSNLFEKQNIYVDSVYSIGLDNGISFLINGVEVAGLGHGVTGDEVLTHPYFGSDLIFKDIFELDHSGYCVIEPKQIIRSDDTGLICRIAKK